MKKIFIFHFIVITMAFCNLTPLFAHCDTQDGPVVSDAKTAIANNNVNYVLKWVHPGYENEIKDAFNLSMKVRNYGPEAQVLSDKYFFETLVRIHRSGEGVSYTGLKPSGTPVDEKILAADEAIETGNLMPLEKYVTSENKAELKRRFDKAMSLKNFDVNNVEAGREYIEAYVQFFHFAEGATEDHAHEHSESSSHLFHLPWVLSGIFLFTSLLFGILYFRKK